MSLSRLRRCLAVIAKLSVMRTRVACTTAKPMQSLYKTKTTAHLFPSSEVNDVTVLQRHRIRDGI